MEPVLHFRKMHSVDIFEVLDESGNPRSHIGRNPRIRWIADDYGEALVPFDFVHGGGFVGKGVEADERKLFRPRFEGVGELDSDALLSVEAVAGLSEFETNFHVGDGVGGHHKFEGVQSR